MKGPEYPMDRRRFLSWGTGAAALWVSGCGGDSGTGTGMGPGVGPGMGSPGSAPGTLPPAGLAFAAPPVAPAVRNGNVVEVTLTAAPTTLALGNGLAPGFWAYNGSVPGPTIEVNEGDRVRVTFRNRLPLDSTVHWHGMPVPADQDGNPMDPVAPGADRVYEFTLPAGSAGTYWYHPHAHRTTHEQVFRGLAGLVIVRDPRDPLTLAGVTEVPMVVGDLRLDARGLIAPNTAIDMIGGRIGAMLLVNGRRSPRLAIRAGETQRWRVLNASSARFLELVLEQGSFTLVGSDGGLLGAPVAGLARVRLAPAERVELLVTGAGQAGALTSVDTLAHAGGMMMGGAGSPAARLLTLETVAGAASPFALPAALRLIAELPAATSARRVVLSGDGMMSPFAIDGRTFEMGRVDAVSRRGEAERWEVANASFMDHPFHIHGTQFQVVARSLGGRTAPEPWLAWKDTVDVRAGETVALKVRHDLPGLRMYHCHILEHEDAGMMATLNVVEAG